MVVSTARYLLRTDVHTFAFSFAANSILSFFPFVVLLMTLIRRVFHSRVMNDVVVELLRDNLPAGRELVLTKIKTMGGRGLRTYGVSLIILFVSFLEGFFPIAWVLTR